MDVRQEQFEFRGTGEEFAQAVERACYSVDGKGVRKANVDTVLSGIPTWIKNIDKASSNLYHGLRVPEICALFEGTQVEYWHYLSGDGVTIDGVSIEVDFIGDHVLQPPNPPLWDLGSHGIPEDTLCVFLHLVESSRYVYMRLRLELDPPKFCGVSNSAR